MNKSNYYSKIFYGYVSALIAVCLLLGVFAYHQLYSEKSRHDSIVSTYFVNNYREAESKIQMFKNISDFLFESDDIKTFANHSAENKYYNYLLVQKNMGIYMKLLTDLNATIAITDFKDTYITPRGTSSQAEYFETTTLDKNSLMSVIDFADENGVFVDANPLYCTFVFKYQYPSANSVYCIINAEKKHFLPISTDSSIFTIADKNSDTVFESKRLAKAFSRLDKSVKWYDITEDNIYVRSSQHINNILYMYEGDYGSSYYSFIFLGILWIILLLSCKKIAIWLSDKIYTPINRILDILGYSENSNEIEFLDNSIKKLIYNNQMLVTQLSESKANIRNGFIADLLFGVVSEKTAEHSIKEYKLSYLDSECLCITFECDYNELNRSIDEYNDTRIIQSNYFETLKKTLCESLSGEFVVIDKAKFAFITPEISKSVLKNKLITILELSDEFYKIHPFIAIGRTVDSIKDIHTSFNDTSEIMARKFDYIEKSILFFDDLCSDTNIFYYPIELENALIENILYGDSTKVNEILTELLNTNLCELSLDKDNMTEFKFAVTATIKRIIKMMNKPISEIFGENNIIYLDISHAASNDELAANIRDIIERLLTYKSESLSFKQRKITSDILKYIEDNYNRDISLSDISEFFCVSPGHISRILKQDVGIGFKEYLDNIRVEEAKKLLLNSSITINRIAEKIGCNNARTFIRMFKNHTGYSPKEYREKEIES